MLSVLTIKVYDTRRQKIVLFKPIRDGQVGIYLCGPTVYDYPHIGHARTYIAFDIIVRYLIYRGYKVKFVVNITDIDDKIINRAKEVNMDPIDFATKFEKIFLEDMQLLNVKRANVYPKVSEHVSDIIKIIQLLISKGYAYQVNSDVYFNVTKSLSFGKLSNQSLNDILAGARVEVDKRKRHPADFALWKSSTKGEPGWKSPFGEGRPGWHIECSALSLKYLGEQFDIHGGARDLIFPHHENEIAQTEAYTNKTPVVKYWLHTGFLTIEGEKMSKSLGNYITVRNILKKYDVNSFRLYVALTHYRKPTNYSEKGLEQASRSIKRIINTLDNLRQGMLSGQKRKEGEKEKKIRSEIQTIKKRFLKAMDNDFSTAKALAEFFQLIKLGNKASYENVNITIFHDIYNLIIELGSIFSLKLEKKYELTEEEKKLIEERNIARKNKDWKKADEIREKLRKKGIVLKDYPSITLWSIERRKNKASG